MGKKKGIVGVEALKLNDVTETVARAIIRSILNPDDTLVSGGCHLEGIDIIAEEEATDMGISDDRQIIFTPTNLRWQPDGYKRRNLKIANESEEVHCITIKEYPPTYTGMRFKGCYHCKTDDHVKSGGCWTAKRGKRGFLHIINPDGTYTSREIETISHRQGKLVF